MKRSKLSLLLSCLLVTGSLLAQNYVSLYEDCQYGGRRYFLEPGSYRMYAMKIGNDRLSSLQVPQGLKVTLYSDDNFRGNARTITANIACLDSGWNDNASSIVVESTGPVYNANDYVVFYNDCYERGFSRTLRPGTYTGNDLGNMKYNISSFRIYGNLQVKVYLNNENASGYNTIYAASQSCLPSSYNDRIGSVVIETRQPGSGGGGGGSYNQSLVSFYTNCNYEGNCIRLQPGNYSGEKLGLFRYDISSLEIPAGMRVRVYANDNLGGSSTLLDQNETCLSYSLNDRIGSLSIESGFGNGGPVNGPGNETVVFFTDGSYRGQSATVLPGSYSNMAQLGFPDKALSSLTVPSGYRVVLYEYENFGGRSISITESRSSFGFSNWNDRASSVKVYRDR